MKHFFIFLLAVSFLCNMHAQNKSGQATGIIPAPNSVDLKEGKYISLTTIRIYLPETVGSPYIKSMLADLPGVELTSDSKSTDVLFKTDAKMAPQAYSIDIAKKRITIKAGDKQGFQFALVSLVQMMQYHKLPLPQGKIKDQPAFAYRGMHLDVGRHFFSIADVKKYIDFMAYYKYNHFHWHLTEDQGWRIEIKKYPKLQEVAAWRKETLIGHYNDQPQQFDGKRYGGYYTQEEAKEIVRYAAERNITVIPEIEMPGHAQAALAAYPELGCGTGPYEVATKWGVFDDVFCPNEATFSFLEDVIDEIIPLFPGKYIHIGGDECPKTAWENSAFCKELMQKENLKDAHALQSYFITRMEKYINSKGKQIIGWDEILEGGLAPNATVMSWRGIEGGLAAASQGHDVIMTPTSFCYFDYYQSESPDEPLSIGGYLPMEKVYHWNPIPPGLANEKQFHILGGQANLWTEYIREFSKVEYMAYARGLAMSEALWSKDKDYDGFTDRFLKHNAWWKSQGVNMANHVYDLKPVIKAGDGKDVRVSFSVPAGATIQHIINGNEAEKIRSGQEVSIDYSGRHVFTAQYEGGRGKPLELLFDLHLGTEAAITIDPAPSPSYAGNGPGSIINGIKGSDEKYGGSEWLGFEGTDAIITLDFGKDRNIGNVECRFFKGEGQWIYLPKEIELSMSMDGVNFTKVTGIKNIDSYSKIADVRLTPYQAHGRYMRLKAVNYGIIPEGRQGGGHPSWLFIDEINVR